MVNRRLQRKLKGMKRRKEKVYDDPDVRKEKLRIKRRRKRIILAVIAAAVLTAAGAVLLIGLYNRKQLGLAKQLAAEKRFKEALTEIEKCGEFMVDKHERDRTGQKIWRNVYCAKMITVEGGTFLMGSEKQEDEKPVHTVKVSSFMISRYEVTFDDYEAYCRATGRKVPDDQGWGRGTRPVMRVSWYDAVLYCNWLSRKQGLTQCYTIDGTEISCNFKADGCRLPAEAEWEFAARGGNMSKGFIWSGSDNPDEAGWYGRNSGKQTHPAGEKKPNELEIYDMSGNVREWCWDWYDSQYYEKSPVDNPRGPSGKPNRRLRVLRGGSFSYNALLMRTADRFNLGPESRLSDNGFRVVRTAVP